MRGEDVVNLCSVIGEGRVPTEYNLFSLLKTYNFREITGYYSTEDIDKNSPYRRDHSVGPTLPPDVVKGSR